MQKHFKWRQLNWTRVGMLGEKVTAVTINELIRSEMSKQAKLLETKRKLENLKLFKKVWLEIELLLENPSCIYYSM